MPTGLTLTSASVALCRHGGKVTHPLTAMRVKVSGSPVLVAGRSMVVGCGEAQPPRGPGPCLSADWVTLSVRVKVMGKPLLLSTSVAVTEKGAPVAVTFAGQSRVRAG